MPFTTLNGELLGARAQRRPRAEAAAARGAGIAATAIAPQHAILATARFALATPVPLQAGQAVAVEVSSQLEAFTVELYSSAEILARSERVELGGSGVIRYHVAVDRPLELWGLQVRAPATATDGHLELLAAAVTHGAAGLFVHDGTLIAGSGFAARHAGRFDGAALWPVDLELAAGRFPPDAAPSAAARSGLAWLLAISLHNAPHADSGELRIDLEADGASRTFVLVLRPGRQFVHLHGGEVGFRPRRLRLHGAAPEEPVTGLVALAVGPLPPARSPAELVALPADLGAPLSLEPAFWRRPEFELYAWNGARTHADQPVLVFDTVDYATQARLFRRLAFYVEKSGYRGRLLTDGELQGRRGYNAHDYAAADLARFFSAAQTADLTLTAEEQLLRAVAVTHGIIQPDPGGGWQSGAGAILSISQASSPALRRLLLAHEALHGLYFTHPAYQDAALARWQELTADERLFWRLLLAAVGYDIEVQDLVVNEFQAYLLQQDAARVGNLLALWAGRLAPRHPQHEDTINAVAADGSRWRALHHHLATALAETTGVQSSVLSLLRVAHD